MDETLAVIPNRGLVSRRGQTKLTTVPFLRGRSFSKAGQFSFSPYRRLARLPFSRQGRLAFFSGA